MSRLERSWKRLLLVRLCVILSLFGTSTAFVPHQIRRWHIASQLWATKTKGKRLAAVSPKFAKTVKGKSPKSKLLKESSTPPEVYQPAKKSPGKKSSPPWQVLSTKEAAKNVEAEKERRQNIKEGLATTHEKAETDDSPKILSKAFLSDAESKLLKWKRFNPDKAIQGQRFVGAYLDRKLPPRLGVPEVAFLGRSNVGKSSLLNRLSRNDQARVGKTPGATASVNLYALLDGQGRDILGFTDLPGFGYAKLSKDVQESVMQAAEHYLDRRTELALGILLVDIRRTPSNDDRAVLAALFDMGVPIVVVATKLDKVDSASERDRLLLSIQDGLGLPDGQPLTVSSVTGEGSRDLWRIILRACETCVGEVNSKYSDEVPELYNDDEEEEHDPWYDFEDSDDLVYDQGYDWIHGSDSVGYVDDNENDRVRDDDANASDNFDDEPSDSNANADESLQQPRETLKTLRKRVKIMQKRGEI